jgi:hypothetical protein
MKLMRNLALVAVVVLLALAGPARADIPPPDACTAPGQPCTNAGAGHDQGGTCTMSTCTKTVPSPDGGTMSMSYACNLCQVAQGGSGGAGGGTGSGGAGAPKPPPSKDSGCALGGGIPAGSSEAVLVGAGLLGLFQARRRRRS